MENEMITVREIAKFLRISLPSAYKLVNWHQSDLLRSAPTWLEKGHAPQ